MRKKLLSISTNKLKTTMVFCFAVLLNVGLMNGQTDIAVNGGFESGDFTGWTQFENGTVQTINTTNPSEGTYCVQLNNTVPAVASVIKNANVGIGTAAAGQEVTITLDARGTTAAGGVVFVKIISEIDGGGTSGDQLFGPLALDADPDTWKSFSFVSTLGSDVSGGVSLELTATTGGDASSLANVFFDNVKLTLTDVGPTARVQVIHNSPDDVASAVDVYLDGDLLLNDFAFRTASPFVDAPAGTPISVAIAPSNSTSVADAIATFPFTLTEGETYVIVADGITGLSTTTYTPAPAFGLEVYPMGQEAAATAGNTDLLVHHGSTDAPTVDVNEVSGPAILVDDISYGEFDPNGYLELPTADYNINISTADGLTVVESYDAPLATLGLDDAAAVVVASGFLDPAANGNGPAFGLWVALPTGGALVELPVTGAATGNNVTVDVNATWLGYVNAFNVADGSFATGFPKDVALLKTTIGTDNITLQPNFELYNAADPFWSNGAIGNKIVECSTFVEPGGSFNGNDLTFSGTVDSNTLGNDALGNPYEAKFFIKALDPGAGFSDALGGTKIIDLPASGAFTVSATGAELAPGLIVQYGFYIKGLNANPTEEASLGSIVVSAAALSTPAVEEMTFKAYPNPTQDTWTVKTKNIKMSSIQVFDILGKNVMSLQPETTEATIDASGLKSGLYFAKISTANGSSSLKLVKQ